MKWELAWNDPFTQYLQPFETLIGDRRTWVTFTETVRGIIGSDSLVCQQIAAHAPLLATAVKGAQRIIRMVTGETIKRSPDLDAVHVTAHLRTMAVTHLRDDCGDELWLLADGSDLRKPYAKEMPDFMQVRSLDKRLVPGYRTLTVVGVTPHWRGVFYHHLFSANEAGFRSESYETQQALTTVSRALTDHTPQRRVTWVLDSGFDDEAVWRTIWEQDEHVVCRLCHTNRLISYQTADGVWLAGSIADAQKAALIVTQTQTMLEAQKRGQPRAKRQHVTVTIRACPIRVTYATNVRRTGSGQMVSKDVWLVEVRLDDTTMEPWLLLSDAPITTPTAAERVFHMYRQRWGAEDTFKFTKECLGWEEVQLLDLTGIRILVALAWVAAAFLYDVGVSLTDDTIQLLAKLGGWECRPNRPPGKITLTRGLRRLVDLLTTETWLQTYYREQGPFPPQFTAFLHGWKPHS